MHGSVAALGAWDNFYVIVGSGAAALTGLMFVVITLISSISARRNSGASAAFSGPNVVHFSAALFVSAMLAAPWQALWPAALVLGVCGACGMIYVIIVYLRMRRQKDYVPVLEDWAFHIILPLASYLTFVIGAFVLPFNPTPTLFAIAAATILFLLIGIHNAWDTVTYVTFQFADRDDTSQEEIR
ncbi:MAG TPA: hypothetical protein VMV29_15910 [Ktedonobacterales bacterium]|nr:hypothetical protein [Ktedonobacterales bacterium]